MYARCQPNEETPGGFRREVADYLCHTGNMLIFRRDLMDSHISWNYGGPHAPTMIWALGVAGLGIALPSVDYLAVLAVILASGAAAMTQVAALLLFNVTAFAVVEVSFVACLLAPEATRRSVTALNAWVASRRRLEVAALLVVVGCVLLATGFAAR